MILNMINARCRGLQSKPMFVRIFLLVVIAISFNLRGLEAGTTTDFSTDISMMTETVTVPAATFDNTSESIETQTATPTQTATDNTGTTNEPTATVPTATTFTVEVTTNNGTAVTATTVSATTPTTAAAITTPKTTPSTTTVGSVAKTMPPNLPADFNYTVNLTLQFDNAWTPDLDNATSSNYTNLATTVQLGVTSVFGPPMSAFVACTVQSITRLGNSSEVKFTIFLSYYKLNAEFAIQSKRRKRDTTGFINQFVALWQQLGNPGIFGESAVNETVLNATRDQLSALLTSSVSNQAVCTLITQLGLTTLCQPCYNFNCTAVTCSLVCDYEQNMQCVVTNNTDGNSPWQTGCQCAAHYLLVGGSSCVDENVIIIATSVVGGVVLIALLVISIVACFKMCQMSTKSETRYHRRSLTNDRHPIIDGDDDGWKNAVPPADYDGLYTADNNNYTPPVSFTPLALHGNGHVSGTNQTGSAARMTEQTPAQDYDNINRPVDSIEMSEAYLSFTPQLQNVDTDKTYAMRRATLADSATDTNTETTTEQNNKTRESTLYF